MAKYNLHKDVWRRIQSEIVPLFKQRGYVEHPLYERMWIKENQMYEYFLMSESFTSGILEGEIYYHPRSKSIWIKITNRINTRNWSGVEEFDHDPDSWFQDYGQTNWTEYRLDGINTRRFGLYLSKNPYRIRFKKKDLSDNNLDEVFRNLKSYLPYLFDAALGNEPNTKYIRHETRAERYERPPETKAEKTYRIILETLFALTIGTITFVLFYLFVRLISKMLGVPGA